MCKIKYNCIINKIVFVISLFFSTSNTAQISSPTPVGFTQICASPSFNTYTLNFSYTQASFTGGNVFSLQMSAPDGTFTTPTVVTILTSSSSAGNGSFTFSVPNTTAGQNYRFRILSTSPALVGPSTGSIAAYFRVFDNAFYINNQSGTATYCSGGSFILSIDPNTTIDPSPLPFTNLKYKWYKNNVVIPAQIGTSLSVNLAGTYYVEIDYGSCTTPSSITRSQNVIVTQSVTGLTFPVTASVANPLCTGQTTLLSTTTGYAYQWFKDNEAIAGATNNTYIATQPGIYYVNVNAGSCSAQSSSYTVVFIDFTSSLDIDDEEFILPGQSVVATVTTTAISPTFKWFLNNVEITTETTNTITANQEGIYKVEITQNSSCVVTNTLLFKLTFGTPATKIPSVVSPNNDGKNDTWKLPTEYIGTAANTKIRIISEQGKEVLNTSDYQNDWPQTPIDFKSISPVFYYIITKQGKGDKKGSITFIR